MKSELGDLRALNAWKQKIFDYGGQAKADGYIALVWPNGGLRDIDWVDLERQCDATKSTSSRSQKSLVYEP